MRHYEHAHLLSNIEKLQSLHFPFGQYVPFLGTQPEVYFLQLAAHVEKDRPSLFVASLQSTSFVVSPAEGEGAPGSSGPVHSGHTAQQMLHPAWCQSGRPQYLRGSVRRCKKNGAYGASENENLTQSIRPIVQSPKFSVPD